MQPSIVLQHINQDCMMTLEEAQTIAGIVAENPNGARKKYVSWDEVQAAIVILVRNGLITEAQYVVVRKDS